jgi:hypothetical protein
MCVLFFLFGISNIWALDFLSKAFLSAGEVNSHCGEKVSFSGKCHLLPVIASPHNLCLEYM